MTGPRGDAARRIERREFLRWGAGAGLWLLAGGLPGRAGAARFPETARCWLAMGSLFEVRVPDLPPGEAIEAIRRVRRRVDVLEAAMTRFRAGSPLVRLNRSPVGAWVELPGDLVAALAAAVDAHRATAGAFDPALAPALEAWGVGLEVAPDTAASGSPSRARTPGAGALELDVANRRARRLHPGLGIDLGGIGKGIAADAALAELTRAGSGGALINHGGSLAALGPPPDETRGWPVGVAHPRRPGEVWTRLRLRRGHLATSGDYERFRQTDAGRVHHLIDPRRLAPVAGVVSTTVHAARGVEADVASTARFVADDAVDGPRLRIEERDGALMETASGFGSAPLETDPALTREG